MASEEFTGDAFSISASMGGVKGVSCINKFGRNRDVDGAEDIWGGGDIAAASSEYTYQAAAGIHYISSSTAGAVDIEVQGLDANWDPQTVTVTLASTTKTQIGTGETFIRIFRAKNVGATDLAGIVFIYEDDTVSAGVPDTNTKIKAVINGSDNQTLMAMYTIPNGKTGVLADVTAGSDKGVTAGNAGAGVIIVQAREFGGVFQHKSTIPLSRDGGMVNHGYPEGKPTFPAKTDIKCRVEAIGVASSDVTAEFDLYLIDDGMF